jgi:uncharacterized protein YjbI with pentapeptide repeats
MANEEHVRILRSGVEKWNEWRSTCPEVKPDLEKGDLHGVDLTSINLSGSELSGVIFHDAILREANFTSANLSDGQLADAVLDHANLDGSNLYAASFDSAKLIAATLRRARLHDTNLYTADLAAAKLNEAELLGANLHGVFLNDADLSNASMLYVDLSQANLHGANFCGLSLGWCSFVNTSLGNARFLEAVTHVGPSSIAVDTLERTVSDLTKGASNQHGIEIFLEGAGTPQEYIEFFRSRIGKPIQFYSAFISYSTKDQAFADRLYADLRQENIRVWLATEDLKIGAQFRLKINESIHEHEKLVLILSEKSIDSSWVEHEVKQALAREQSEGSLVLFPIRIDDAVMETPEPWAAKIRKNRHIGDFRKWKDHDEYQKSLTRLIRDLQADDKKTSSR